MRRRELKRALGPSLIHSAGAVGLTLFCGGIGALLGHGVVGLSYGAGAATAWFVGREIEQIHRHWGWTNWAIDASPEEQNRAFRQAGWPALAANATAVIATLLWA